MFFVKLRRGLSRRVRAMWQREERKLLSKVMPVIVRRKTEFSYLFISGRKVLIVDLTQLSRELGASFVAFCTFPDFEASELLLGTLCEIRRDPHQFNEGFYIPKRDRFLAHFEACRDGDIELVFFGVKVTGREWASIVVGIFEDIPIEGEGDLRFEAIAMCRRILERIQIWGPGKTYKDWGPALWQNVAVVAIVLMAALLGSVIGKGCKWMTDNIKVEPQERFH